MQAHVSISGSAIVVGGGDRNSLSRWMEDAVGPCPAVPNLQESYQVLLKLRQEMGK